MSETKFLLRDARDQINLELRKVCRRLSAEVYAELEAAILFAAEDNVQVVFQPDTIRERLKVAINELQS